MQTWGVPNSPFQWLSEYTPHTPPPLGNSAGTNEATKAPTPENAPCWHEIMRPREICVTGRKVQRALLIPLSSFYFISHPCHFLSCTSLTALYLSHHPSSPLTHLSHRFLYLPFALPSDPLCPMPLLATPSHPDLILCIYRGCPSRKSVIYLSAHCWGSYAALRNEKTRPQQRPMSACKVLDHRTEVSQGGLGRRKRFGGAWTDE